MKSLKSAWQLIKETLSSWSDDKAPRMGAALSYYTAFSLAPVLVLSFQSPVWYSDGMPRRAASWEARRLAGHDSATA